MSGLEEPPNPSHLKSNSVGTPEHMRTRTWESGFRRAGGRGKETLWRENSQQLVRLLAVRWWLSPSAEQGRGHFRDRAMPLTLNAQISQLAAYARPGTGLLGGLVSLALSAANRALHEPEQVPLAFHVLSSLYQDMGARLGAQPAVSLALNSPYQLTKAPQRLLLVLNSVRSATV